ncbi:MAG: hypothetical protein L0H38_02465 [bacterium]|nr:hypothetical protein [bacterium]
MSEYIASEPEKSVNISRLLDIAELYLDIEEVDFASDLADEDKAEYIYARLIEIGQDPEFILNEFAVYDLDEGDQEDFIMSDIDARAETLGDIFNHTEAFAKVIQLINRENSNEV